jgi:hypothetical protein
MRAESSESGEADLRHPDDGMDPIASIIAFIEHITT